MITNNGKELIAKFLLGQAPAYATHIGLGCGSRPGIDAKHLVTGKSVSNNVATLTSPDHGYRIDDILIININDSTYNGSFKVIDTTKNTFSYYLEHADNSNNSASGEVRLSLENQQCMNFEMMRIPISSRGYVNENGVTKIVFAAEMPTSQRLLVSEASLWSAGYNVNANNSDSRILCSFDMSEGWKYHHGETIEDMPFKPFLNEAPPDIDKNLVGQAFITMSDTPVMKNASRVMRYEPGRYSSNQIFLRGDSSKLNSSDNSSRHGIISPDISYLNDHIHLDTVAVDLSKNNPNDEIRLAFSLVSVVAQNPVPPAKTRVYVEFLHSESDSSHGYARLFGEVYSDDIEKNRYVVLNKKLSDMIVSPDFSWGKVRMIRIYASCYDANGNLDSNNYVALDGMRFENLNSPNPLYTMSGYSIYSDDSTVSPQPINKVANTSNYIEFRTNLGVI